MCSRTCPWLHSVTKRAHLYWRTDALPMKLASDLERRTGVRHQRYPEAPRQPEKAVTCGENQAARNQTVDAPSVHQLNARWKTPVHAHGASNHTMDTNGTCHPQKMRWYALTWKPAAKMSIRHRRNKGCVTVPQMPHKTHALKKHNWSISYHWEDMTLFPMKDARCPRHIAHATSDTCDKQKSQRQHFVEDEHSSRHTCAQQTNM